MVFLKFQTLFNRRQLLAISIISALSSVLLFLHAEPLNGKVMGGSGSINQSGLNTTIQQNSASLAINWDSFNLGQNEVVNFLQPNSSSIALNRILSSNGSQIHGQINANGQVVLVNPNGLFFGQNASVNVGGLIASGLDFNTSDFMYGYEKIQACFRSLCCIVADSGFIIKRNNHMASIHELAKLSAMAYDAKQMNFSGWTRIDQHGEFSGKGFYAELYSNRKRKEVAMAFRGTDFEEEDWSDFYSDIQIGLGKSPSQLKHAETAYKKFRQTAERRGASAYNLYLTGHSLGGGLASLLSAKKNGLPTVTFNAPGMQRSYIGSHLINLIGHINLKYIDTRQMLHVRATGDPVSKAAGKHMGTVKEIYVDEWGDGKLFGSSRHLAQHSIDNMVSSTRNKYWCQTDLGYKTRRVEGA